MPRRPKKIARSVPATKARLQAIRRAAQRMVGGTKFADGKHGGMTVHELPRQDAWVVFKNWCGEPRLQPAEIVVVCKRTKRVLYDGPLNERP